MTIAETARSSRIAWRAAEILEETADHTPDSITDRILSEHGWSYQEEAERVRSIVHDVMTGAWVVDLRRAGHFAV